MEAPVFLEVAVADHGAQGEDGLGAVQASSCSADVEPVADQVSAGLSQAWRLLGGLAPPRLDGAALRAWSGPDGSAALIDHLRAGGTVLTYDLASRTLRAGGHDAPSVVIGKDATDTHARQNKERRTA